MVSAELRRHDIGILRIDAEEGVLVMMEQWAAVSEHWMWVLGGVFVVGGAWMLWRGTAACAARRQRGLQVREELEAYARLDPRLPQDGDVRGLGKRVCRVVAEKSAFQRAALLARAGDGRLFVAASAGVDDVTVEALQEWSGRLVAVRGESEALTGQVEVSVGCASFEATLEVMDERAAWRRVVVVAPMWSGGGRLVGALVVSGADGLEQMGPLETLAAKLARTLENAALAERLLRSEKLASLGQLAGGVAHALNNPLTAVLGYAELIAETTDEAQVQEDAETIVREALRMQGTVQSLLDFWRPATLLEEPVELGGLVRELTEECGAKLAGRGVRLVVEVAGSAPTIWGNRDRLRTVMEHLLNNAAQAVGDLEGGEHTIRVSVTHDERGVQVIVSDTGVGFEEPGRVFDPFYTTRGVGEGAGLGLSICYGIVKEHGGEISAFNLHPRGAAVVVELPVRVAVMEEAEEAEMRKAG